MNRKGVSTFQVPLDFGEAQVRRKDPATSKAAAKNVNVSSMRRAIIGFVKNRAELGATTFEIAEDMGVPRDYISPHMKWLCLNGYLWKTDKERSNPKTKSKVKSEVYQSFNNLPISDNHLWAAMMQYADEKRLTPLFDKCRSLVKLNKHFPTELSEFLRRIENDYRSGATSEDNKAPDRVSEDGRA